MSKRVIVFFSLLFSLGLFLFLFQVSHFGGITGFVVSEQQGIKADLSVEKIYVEDSNENGEYFGEIRDFGELVEIESLNWDENIVDSRVIYSLTGGGNDENDENVLVSYDDGENWEMLEDEEKINEILNARTKGDLVEESDMDVQFEIKVCEKSSCEGSNFVEVDLDKINLEGRYFQYKIIFSGVQGKAYVENIKLEYSLINQEKVIDNPKVEDKKDNLELEESRELKEDLEIQDKGEFEKN